MYSMLIQNHLLKELWSGLIPFSSFSEAEVIFMLFNQKLPDVNGITAKRSEFRLLKERVLSICSLCWTINPIIRPSMETIATLLRCVCS